ncbi:uncharacterized protein LOC135462606 [Liolophura sinensis]|uniref:uncharacterized protein LOC135462606 n=1 Tax=Liolophura sinensis TaxID=3198878 RepID=UPI003158F0CC
MKPPKSSVKKNIPGSTKSMEGSAEGHSRQPSLKDLCVEDKQRVANLIKELAKLVQSKKKAVEQMHLERINFEKEILKLLEQQESVLNERQTIQAQLLLCQQALTVYQQKLTEQEQQAGDKKKKERKGFSSKHRSVKGSCDRDQSPYSEVTEEESDQDICGQTTQRRRAKTRSIDEIPRQKPNVESDEEEFKFKGSSRRSKVNTPTCQDEVESHKDELQRLETEKLANVQDRLSNNFRQLDLMEQMTKEKDGFRTPPLSKASSKRHKSHGPLPEPVMSSTQKSSEIIGEMSFKSPSSADNYFPLQTDSSFMTRDNLANSFRGRHPSSGEVHASKTRQVHRVDFAPEDQYDNDSGPFHSPNVVRRNSDKFADPDFVEYYRKLSSKQRKKELMSQRNALLGEQKRLRQILQEQEEMLKVKRDQLHQQQIVQAKRLAHFEQNGVFPLADDERLQSRHPKVQLEEANRPNGEDMMEVQRPVKMYELLADRHRIDNKALADEDNFSCDDSKADQGLNSDYRVRFQTVGEIKGGNLSRKSSHLPTEVQSAKAVDPPKSSHSPHRGHLVSTATSPMNVESDRRDTMSTSATETNAMSPRQPVGSPKGANAAASYSHLNTSVDRDILSSPGGSPSKQGNLPLMSNRQKTSLKASLNTSGDKKGLSVLEILEKLESEANTSLASNSSAHRNSSLNSKGDNYVLKNSSYMMTRREVSDDDESLAELEESKVLEDVFFLNGDRKGLSVLEMLEKLESEANTSLASNSSAHRNSSLNSKGDNYVLKNSSYMMTRREVSDDDESLAELEESKVLEDVFFLNGDRKGLSVLEILEKLESEANTSLASNSSAHRNNSLNSKGDNYVLKNSSYMMTRREVSDDDESLAELEESKVLEDVFFLNGDRKGLSVLEILEKLESEANTSLASNSSAHRNNSLNSKGDNYVLKNSSYMMTRREVSDDDESLAELEESKVLEDVFFLK